jgi:hypothetical protein
MKHGNMNKNVLDTNQPYVTSQRTFENILDEYKIISVKLFEQSNEVVDTINQCTLEATKQAKLLDAQQSLLIEARSMKINSGQDVFALFELWKADEIYSNKATPSQGIVLHLRDYFKQKLD